ncbi:MAG: hypothetical protein IID60_09335 [Proteobacteria bacterium]|nr:hypothetical protein [Pseudomonadota bacterium]
MAIDAIFNDDNGDSSGHVRVFSLTSTPEELIVDLTEAILILAELDDINNGVAKSRVKKLENALKDIAAGDIRNACKSMLAFINSVDAKTGKKLTEEDANFFISKAEAIREALECI